MRGERRRYVGAGDGMGEIRLVHVDGKVIPVEFQRKHIKRMHLHVKGPEGRVVL